MMNFRLVYTVVLFAFSFLLDQSLVLENPHAKISQYDQQSSQHSAELEIVLHAVILPSANQKADHEKEKFNFDFFRVTSHPCFFRYPEPLQGKLVAQNLFLHPYFLEFPCFRGPPKSPYPSLASLFLTCNRHQKENP